MNNFCSGILGIFHKTISFNQPGTLLNTNTPQGDIELSDRLPGIKH